jgi:hypothetical protein
MQDNNDLNDPALEPHLTPGDIAKRWKISEDSVRRRFKDEPGVLKLGHPTRLIGRKYQRHYFALRIPMSVFKRVENALMNKRQPESVSASAPVVRGNGRDLRAS